MMKWKNSPQNFQEEMTAKELLKTDINSISDQEFIKNSHKINHWA